MHSYLFFNANGITYTLNTGTKHTGFSTSYPYFYYLKPYKWPAYSAKIRDFILDKNTQIYTSLTKPVLRNIFKKYFGLLSSSIKLADQKTTYYPPLLKSKETIQPLISIQKTNTVFLYLDFWGYILVEAIQQDIGGHQTYVVNSFSASYNLPQLYNQYKQFLVPLLTVPFQHNEIMELILNLNFFTPFKTSSNKVKDLTRSAILSLLIKESPNFAITKEHVGTIYVTGPIVSFIDDIGYLINCIIDGIGTTGLWAITIDKEMQILSALLSKQPPRLSNTTHILAYISPNAAQTAEQLEFIDTQNNLHKVLVPPSNTVMAFSTKNLRVKSAQVTPGSSLNATHSLSLATPLKLTTIVLDSRPRPIQYGPSPAHNALIKATIDKINKPTPLK